MIADWEDILDRECSMLSAGSYSLVDSKKLRSSGVNSAIGHKVTDAVVNGATSTSQKLGKAVVKVAASARQKAAESVVNSAIDSTKKWFVGRKWSMQPSVAEPIIVPQGRKLDIDSLIERS